MLLRPFLRSLTIRALVHVQHGFGNSNLLYARSETDRQLERLGPNVSQVFSGKLSTSVSTRCGSTHCSGWSNLKPKQTVPFLLSSHGLGMWAMMDYYGEAWMGWRKSLLNTRCC